VSFSDLRELVAHLERRGQLRRVGTPVSRDLEITEIVDRVSKSNGDANIALLFERVEGFDIPVLVNTFGSADRMATALGVERLDDLGARVAKLLDLKLPGSFLDKMRKLGSLLDVAKASPRHVRTAPCQEVVETANPSLAVLPKGGPSISASRSSERRSRVHSRSPRASNALRLRTPTPGTRPPLQQCRWPLRWAAIPR